MSQSERERALRDAGDMMFNALEHFRGIDMWQQYEGAYSGGPDGELPQDPLIWMGGDNPADIGGGEMARWKATLAALDTPQEPTPAGFRLSEEEVDNALRNAWDAEEQRYNRTSITSTLNAMLYAKEVNAPAAPEPTPAAPPDKLLEQIEIFGVMLAACEIECGTKHSKAFKELSDMRDTLLAAAPRPALSPDALRDAAEKLLAKLDAIDGNESYQSIVTIAHIHGVNYTGPNWADEYDSVKAALAPAPREGA